MGAAQPPIRTVGLVVSLNRQRARDAAGPLIARLRRAGVEVRVSDEAASDTGSDVRRVPPAEVVKADLVIVLGGDGTLLHTAGQAAPFGVPVLGVDLGSFGFLAEAQLDDLYAQLDQILRGDFRVDERLMIRATVQRGDTIVGSWTGLNDAVVGVCAYSRLVRLGIALDGEPVATYSSDGLVVATPTGSTGYSLSAGGPVVDPRVDSFIITPICPHTLQARPVVVASTATVSVTLEQTSQDVSDVVLRLDGDLAATLQPHDLVAIRKAEFGAKLVRIGTTTFYGRLRDKLSWGLSH